MRMSADEQSGTTNKAYVRSLERGLVTIRALGEFPDGATLSEVSAKVDLDRATTRRLLLTLVDMGYVRQDKKQFVLAPRVLELGFSYFSSMPVWEAAQPFLDSYCETTLGTISIGVLDNAEVIYVARAQSRRSVYAINVTVGSRFPCYSTSMGRVLLSGLPNEQIAEILGSIELKARTPNTTVSLGDLMASIENVRDLGYAISNEETEIGIRSIAVPLRNRKGDIAAALNTSFQVSYATTAELVETYLPQLRDVAAKIEALNMLPSRKTGN